MWVRIPYGKLSLQVLIALLKTKTACRGTVILRYGNQKTLCDYYRCNYIAAFQLAGYFVWNEEAAGSSPACYTTGVVEKCYFVDHLDGGSNPSLLKIQLVAQWLE